MYVLIIILKIFFYIRNIYSFFALAIFQSPVVGTTTNTKNSISTVTTFPSSSPRIQSSSGFNSTSQTTSPTTLFDKAPTNNVPLVPLPSRSVSPVTPVATVVSTAAILPTVPTSTFRQSPSPNTPIAYSGGQSPGVLQVIIVYKVNYLLE